MAVDTEPDGELKLPEPTEFTAFTVNVYEVLVASPVTVQVRAGAVIVQVLFPGEDFTWYDVMPIPPSSSGASHDTSICVSPEGVPVTDFGAPGSVGVREELDGEDAALVPIAFVALTVKV